MEGGIQSEGLRIGMTGGIACGKTTASDALGKRGWRVIDTDAIARACLEPGHEGYKKTVDLFGDEILVNGTISRAQLAQLVFANSEKLRVFNSLLHPLIRQEWKSQLISHLQEKTKIPVVVVIPLLFETSAEKEFDIVISLGCSESSQMSRLALRGWDMTQITQRLAAQWSVEEKMNRSDIVIWNDGSEACLFRQLDRLDRQYHSPLSEKE
ncbi:MAG: dephospho-CoA kinase [Verrucomicrobiota bacterium]